MQCGEVIKRFEAEGFKIRGTKMLQMSDELLQEHYAHLVDKPVFPDLVEFMKSTPIIAIALEGEDVIRRARDLLGPTDSTQADPGTIRGDLGINTQKNVCHAADSSESAAVELKRFFSGGEIFSY